MMSQQIGDFKMPPKDRSVQDFVDKCRECGKQKTGHWIIYDVHGRKACECSECGGEPYYSNTIYNYKFCPYCGAKMVEAEEEQEPKTGYWKRIEVRGNDSLVCSECFADLGSTYPENYCPNCGVKMVEPQESEE